MYTNADIEHLNRYGSIGVSYLSWKHKLLPKEAKKILRRIVADFENVKFVSNHSITITEPKERKKRKSKFIDVNRP